MRAAPDASLPALTRHDGVLSWPVPEGWWALSSAAVGGGLCRPRWVLNAGVDESFARTDLEAWAGEVSAGLGLDGPGCALLTAADVGRVEHAHREGVDAWATVGVTKPTWAHDPRAVLSCHGGSPGDRRVTTEPHDRATAAVTHPDAGGGPAPGTVNIVVAVPVPLSPSALVQAVGTVTEAKAQVLVRGGVPGTGTASDAVVVLCPVPDDLPDRAAAPVPFAGVRSTWGRRVAHAVHDAVLAGLLAHPWTGDDTGEGPVW